MYGNTFGYHIFIRCRKHTKLSYKHLHILFVFRKTHANRNIKYFSSCFSMVGSIKETLLKMKNFTFPTYNCVTILQTWRNIIHLFWMSPYAATRWDFICPHRTRISSGGLQGHQAQFQVTFMCGDNLYQRTGHLDMKKHQNIHRSACYFSEMENEIFRLVQYSLNFFFILNPF